MIHSYTLGPIVVNQVDILLQDRDTLLATLKENLQMAQNRMKVYHDKHHSEREFTVGDWVFLKLQPYLGTPFSKGRITSFLQDILDPFK